MCDFCDKNVYTDISNEKNWEISSYYDKWDKCYYMDIKFMVNLGDYGASNERINIKMNYCPICGRKLKEENKE